MSATPRDDLEVVPRAAGASRTASLVVAAAAGGLLLARGRDAGSRGLAVAMDRSG